MEKIEAEPERAIYALSLAADLLRIAQEKLAESVFEETLAFSRDSMRVAGSAVLFLDGVVASDLDSSCAHIRQRYGDSIPIEGWRRVESLAKSNIVDAIGDVFGNRKSRVEKNAKEALDAAEKFFYATSTVVIG